MINVFKALPRLFKRAVATDSENLTRQLAKHALNTGEVGIPSWFHAGEASPHDSVHLEDFELFPDELVVDDSAKPKRNVWKTVGIAAGGTVAATTIGAIGFEVATQAGHNNPSHSTSTSSTDSNSTASTATPTTSTSTPVPTSTPTDSNSTLIAQDKLDRSPHGLENTSFQQTHGTGNCQLWGPFYALTQSYQGRQILDHMVQYDPKANEYTVTFPEHPNNSVKVSKDRLGTDPNHVSGDKEAMLIEVAYAELMKQLPQNPYGNISDNDLISLYKSAAYPQDPSITAKDLTGGKVSTYFGNRKENDGKANVDDINPFASSPDMADKIKNLLSNVDFSKKIITGSTSHETTQTDTDKDGLYYAHEFSIVSIDKENKKVTIADPYADSDQYHHKITQEITYDQFVQDFGMLTVTDLPS